MVMKILLYFLINQFMFKHIVKAKGDIKVQNEIKEAIWIDRNYKSKGIKVGSILGKYIIPQLIEKGLM